MPHIYCIFNETNNNIYIGSTSMLYLSMRLAQHRYYYRKNKAGTSVGRYSSEKVFEDSLGEYDCYIADIAEVSKEERTEVESFFIKHFKEQGFDVVNENDSIYSPERYKQKRAEDYKKNPNKYRLRSAQYYYENKDVILKKAKKKYQESKKVL